MSEASKTAAVYAGTFDPITNGHLDIIRRARGVFDQVHVAVAGSSSKKVWFTAEERVAMVNDYEAQMAHINRQLAGDIETVFFVTSEKFSFISSSIVKNVAVNGGDVSPFVPQVVVERLKKVLQSKKS